MNNGVNQYALDDYNPFSETSRDNRYSVSAAVLPDDSGVNVPPVYDSATKPNNPPVLADASNDAIRALERRQAELDLRAAELDRREKEQEARVAALRSAPAPHNWPPLPPWCCCKPCVRQDFEADIPFECRWMARMGYGLWLAYGIVLLFNLGGTLAYFIVGKIGIEGPLFGASILLFLVMPPLTFFGWHRPLYKALRSDSSLNYFVFFILFAIQLIIVLIQCLGIDYLGACGWINGIKTCGQDRGVCGYMLFVAAMFSVWAAAGAFLIFKVHRFYRSSGASFRKARLEMTSAAAYETSTTFGSMP